MSKAKTIKCCICGTALDKISSGLNKKLLNKDSKQHYCLACLANYLDVSVEDLLEKVEEFKEQGCTLF